ncbi:hypothetical protein C8J57DRAFT_1261939 [Mycena rebaudengoi]|nr:hypothetical protein C8J57DRAFT_1261939 [Mycena rebaudengoi]
MLGSRSNWGRQLTGGDVLGMWMGQLADYHAIYAEGSELEQSSLVCKQTQCSTVTVVFQIFVAASSAVQPTAPPLHKCSTSICPHAVELVPNKRISDDKKKTVIYLYYRRHLKQTDIAADVQLCLSSVEKNLARYRRDNVHRSELWSAVEPTWRQRWGLGGAMTCKEAAATNRERWGHSLPHASEKCSVKLYGARLNPIQPVKTNTRPCYFLDIDNCGVKVNAATPVSAIYTQFCISVVTKILNRLFKSDLAVEPFNRTVINSGFTRLLQFTGIRSGY